LAKEGAKMSPKKRKASSFDEESNDVDFRREDKQVRFNAPEPRGGQQEVDRARVVTPHKNRSTDEDDEREIQLEADGGLPSARRRLFPTSPVAVTPSRSPSETNATTITPSPAKRRLIFGRSAYEITINDNVRKVYGMIRKLTGSIGGNSSFGPIYGELTMGSMQKMVNLMKEHAGFNSDSRFIDVGSGIGKPNLHVTQDPGVAFSYGIEVEADRWLLGMNCLKGMLDAAIKQDPAIPRDQKIFHNCIMEHGDITDAKSFDPFTHVYMFSIGFPPKLWEKLSKIWNQSRSKYLVCYHGPKDIINAYKFDAELVVQTATSMHGSKESHSGYIYRRRLSKASSANHEGKDESCDPFFASACAKVNEGIVALKKEVDAKLEARMGSRTTTRARKRRG
jgi:hypothetical protein